MDPFAVMLSLHTSHFISFHIATFLALYNFCIYVFIAHGVTFYFLKKYPGVNKINFLKFALFSWYCSFYYFLIKKNIFFKSKKSEKSRKVLKNICFLFWLFNFLKLMHTPYFLTCAGRKCILVGSSGRKANIITDAH